MSILALTLLACSSPGDDTDAAVAEPLELPADPAATGVPVGVRTVVYGDLTVEVWYPAADATAGEGESIDFADAIPSSVTALLGDVVVPVIPTIAVRDAELRPTDAPYPVVVFSHGLGGTRHQSVDLTTHLASRGYVVIATDHAGRSFQDLLPCLFSPPAEGCDLGAFSNDPGPDDVSDLVDFVSGPTFLGDAVDAGTLGIFGHSAGGGTTATVAQEDDRFLAALPMAGTGAITRDVPVLDVAGTCDGIVGIDGIRASSEAGANTALVTVAGAGHLAFSDLCTLDLGGLAETYLEGRDDLNGVLYDSLVMLGTDGCDGGVPVVAGCDAFLDLDVSAPLLRNVTTTFFDEHLYGAGAGVDVSAFPEAALEP